MTNPDLFTVSAVAHQSSDGSFEGSLVGLVTRDGGGKTQTVTFDNLDSRVSVLVSRDGEGNSSFRVFHVFAGRYMAQVLRPYPMEFEIFRSHLEIWPAWDVTPNPVGEVEETVESGKSMVRRSFEHVHGSRLLDPRALLADMAATSIPRACLPFCVAPVRITYLADVPTLPHPNLWSAEEGESGLGALLCREAKTANRTLYRM